MAFGKRHGDLSGAPHRPPASGFATVPTGLPGAQRVAPKPIQAGQYHVASDLSEIGKGGVELDRAAERITDFLLETYNDQRGVNAETILSAAGALAGFATQQAVWEGLVRPGKASATGAFLVAKAESGELYFFSDLVNTLLMATTEDQLSVWRFIAATAVKLGAQSLPPLRPILDDCSETVGTPAFGVPTLPSHLALKELPRQALRHWSQIKSILLAGGVQPLNWPWVIAIATQNIMSQAKDALPADIAALVVMQAAIRMAKVDPRKVPGGTIVD